MIKIHIFISGRVQGVGFRFFIRLKARSIGLKGWVRNRSPSFGGRVELEAVGSQKEIDQLIVWLQEGPPLAQVDDLEIVSRIKVKNYQLDCFEIRATK
ncbi:MAG: acylphosphatase [Candidatus Shapirobacteria bacterium]|nr:acylphosphatase [Candidatus Shapirobacteria bacterium]